LGHSAGYLLKIKENRAKTAYPPVINCPLTPKPAVSGGPAVPGLPERRFYKHIVKNLNYPFIKSAIHSQQVF
jgi:hypothetical protein